MKTKNVKLYNNNGIWYARYRIKEVVDAASGMFRSRHPNISTMLPATEKYRAQAQKIANDRRVEDIKEFWAVVHGKQERPRKLHDFTPTCGQIVDLYLEKSTINYKKEVSDVFLTVVAEGVGGWGDPADRNKAREVHLSQLTTKTMLAFRDQSARNAVAQKLGLRMRNEVSINTYMRQAKSVFSRKARMHYLDLHLPHNLRDWADVPMLDEDHYEQKFIAIEPDKMAAADAAAPQMLELAKLLEAQGKLTHARRAKNAYACYLLMRYCGLRNIEVENLRWEWFTRRADGEFMVDVIKRSYWKGPKAASGSVPVARQLYAELLSLFGPAVPGSDGFVLCGTMTDRKEGTHRVAQGFMRRYISRGSKNLYCLRKQYATEMEGRYDLKTASALLRHGEGDTQTARDHYVDGNVKLNRVKPLWRS